MICLILDSVEIMQELRNDETSNFYAIFIYRMQQQITSLRDKSTKSSNRLKRSISISDFRSNVCSVVCEDILNNKHQLPHIPSLEKSSDSNNVVDDNPPAITPTKQSDNAAGKMLRGFNRNSPSLTAANMPRRPRGMTETSTNSNEATRIMLFGEDDHARMQAIKQKTLEGMEKAKQKLLEFKNKHFHLLFEDDKQSKQPAKANVKTAPRASTIGGNRTNTQSPSQMKSVASDSNKVESRTSPSINKMTSPMQFERTPGNNPAVIENEDDDDDDDDIPAVTSNAAGNGDFLDDEVYDRSFNDIVNANDLKNNNNALSWNNPNVVTTVAPLAGAENATGPVKPQRKSTTNASGKDGGSASSSGNAVKATRMPSFTTKSSSNATEDKDAAGNSSGSKLKASAMRVMHSIFRSKDNEEFTE